MQVGVVQAELVDSLLLQVIFPHQLLWAAFEFGDRLTIWFLILTLDSLTHLKKLLGRLYSIWVNLVSHENDLRLKLDAGFLVFNKDVGHFILQMSDTAVLWVESCFEGGILIDITNVMKVELDYRPGAIALSLWTWVRKCG